MLIDTHAHVSPYWYEPAETLLFQMDRNGVDRALLVQMINSYDNRYGLDCVHRYPGRFAAVVLVDTQREDAVHALGKWAEEGAAGVRLRPTWRSPGPDPLAIWRKASELGLVVSASGRLEMFGAEEFHRLVREFPNLKIVVEHLGEPGPEPQTDFALFEKVLALANYPNVYIKLPGFGELLPRPGLVHAPPFPEPPRAVRLAYEAFGSRRMMWGSDFPRCMGREGYANALRIPMATPFFSDEDKEWIFGKTALSVWKIKPSPPFEKGN
ncbi:MAG: amidohydrolase [Chloroflexi bacterium]|nr:amidohydrolase [Chloroflexota bacterium]